MDLRNSPIDEIRDMILVYCRHNRNGQLSSRIRELLRELDRRNGTNYADVTVLPVLRMQVESGKVDWLKEGF